MNSVKYLIVHTILIYSKHLFKNCIFTEIVRIFSQILIQIYIQILIPGKLAAALSYVNLWRKPGYFLQKVPTNLLVFP